MSILTTDAQSLLLRRVDKAIVQTRDEASLAWKEIKVDVARRGVSGGSIENTLLREKVQLGLQGLASRLQAEVGDVLRATGLKVTADLIPEILSVVTPLIDRMERGMDKEFGGMSRFGQRLTARLTSDLNDLALLNRVQEDADASRRQAALSPIPPNPADGGHAPLVPTESKARRRFRVSLSFAGEHRNYVRDVADHLVETLGPETVLYDKFFEAEFARSGLDVYLPKLYREESDLVVVFISKQYDVRPWCGLEWRSIRQLIAEKRDGQLMFLRFDQSDVEGILPGDGYAPIVEGEAIRPSREIAELILKRLRIEGHMSSDAVPAVEEDWLAIARSDREQWKRVNAIARLESQANLRGIADQEGDGEVRRAAVRKLLDQDVLLRFARTDPYPRVRMAAVARLTRSHDIESIRTNEKNQDVLQSLPVKGPADQ